MNTLGSFTITAEDSQSFARASGDYNPLHLDPVAARRTRFGQTVIHGVCGTLKALDLLLNERAVGSRLINLKVKYSKPAMQDQVLTVFCKTSGQATRLEIFAANTRCQIIEVTIADSSDTAQVDDYKWVPCNHGADTCVDLSLESCRGLRGQLEPCWDQALMTALFPNATRYLPREQLAVLLASTRIVGMRCPGLHSVFAQLDLHFHETKSEIDTRGPVPIAYKVLTCDPRIERVELSLNNSVVQGKIEAFFRSPPVQQASFTQLASLVHDDEFADQRALVVGASRGLGELITKVLAAGGATVLMTYAAGRDDAVGVSTEIAQYRVAPDVFHYNVLDSCLSADLSQRLASVTHIYYLASPLILKSDSGQWDSQLFARYCSFYIDGLATLLQHIGRVRDESEELGLFIPSTVFLEENVKGFDEYIAAKAAAEAYVRCYEHSHPNCSAYAPRLPRLYTDQTAGIKKFDPIQTLATVIAHVRRATKRNEAAH